MARHLRGSLAVPFAAAVLMACMALSSAQAAAVSSQCNPDPSAVALKASSLFHSTSSTTYVNIPEGSVGFKQGQRGCVIVIFSGVSGNATGLFFVQAVIGGVVGLPANNRWSGNDNIGGVFLRMRSGTYVFPNVPPGRHRVQMQYRVDSGIGFFETGHNLIVYYVP